MAQILSSNMQQIYAYIPQNPDVEFLQKNQEKIGEIRKSLKLLERVEEKCRKTVQEFGVKNDQNTLIQKFNCILKGNAEKKKVFEAELAPL